MSSLNKLAPGLQISVPVEVEKNTLLDNDSPFLKKTQSCKTDLHTLTIILHGRFPRRVLTGSQNLNLQFSMQDLI